MNIAYVIQIKIENKIASRRIVKDNVQEDPEKRWKKIFTVLTEKQLMRIDKKGKKKHKNYNLRIIIYWECKIYHKLIIKSC